MTRFLWILLGGILMSAISLVGSVTVVLRETTRQTAPSFPQSHSLCG